MNIDTFLNNHELNESKFGIKAAIDAEGIKLGTFLRLKDDEMTELVHSLEIKTAQKYKLIDAIRQEKKGPDQQQSYDNLRASYTNTDNQNYARSSGPQFMPPIQTTQDNHNHNQRHANNINDDASQTNISVNSDMNRENTSPTNWTQMSSVNYPQPRPFGNSSDYGMYEKQSSPFLNMNLINNDNNILCDTIDNNQNIGCTNNNGMFEVHAHFKLHHIVSIFNHNI